MRTPPPERYPAYVRSIPRLWWLKTGPYRRFAAREFTSLFAAAFSVILLLFLIALSRGPEAYRGFLRWLELPGTIALSSVILVAAVYHSVTWFRLTSHILPVRLGRWTAPRPLVAAALIATWLWLSVLVAYLHIWR